MPFSRPTLSELRARVASDIATALPGADALLRYSNLGVLGQGQAALAHGHYGYLDWIALQAVPFTATGEYLEGWAALKGVTRKPATPAIGAATFAASGAVGVPAGTPLSRADGIGYATIADAIAANGLITVQLQATTLGAIGNTDAGVGVTFGLGVAGVASTGVFSAPATGGADMEDDDSLRSRMLSTYAAPPQGGNASDFEEWALAVPGVTRCWVTPGGMGAGTVVVYFMLDDAQAAHSGFPQGSDGVAVSEPRGTPATGDQLTLADALAAKAPVPLTVYAVSPVPNPVSLTIQGLAGAPSSVKAAIGAAFGLALKRSAVPGGITDLSAIEAAIAAIAGSAGFVITAIACAAGAVAPGPVGNIVSNAGALPVPGEIIFA